MSALTCCTPWHGAGAWRHARDCPRRRNDKLNGEERARLRAARAHEPMEPMVTGGAADLPRMGTWLMHPDGCTCTACAYVDAHLDDAT